MSLKFFYDPTKDQEVTAAQSLDDSWIRITEVLARQLSEGRSAGGRVYVNASNMPAIFTTPSKPVTAWNERAELSPFQVINGTPTQYWMVSKKSIAEQGAELAKLRWGIQNTGLIYRDVNGDWQVTRDVSQTGGVYVPTDALTMTTLIGVKGDFDKGINISRRWKVRDLHYVYFTNEELTNAYKLGQKHWQDAFDIEAAYGEAIVQGLDVNIYEWQLLTQ